MSRYIDVDKLIEFANNTKDKTIDANDIARFPTADVRENVTGNWIKRIDNLDYGLIEFEGFECSLCGVKIWKDDYENVEFKFCPNCGADMRGDNNGKRNDS